MAGRRARPAGMTGCDCGASRLQRDRGGQEGAEPSGNSSMLGLAGTAAKARQVRGARGRGSGVRCAPVSFPEARPGKAAPRRPQSTATRAIPGSALRRFSCPARPSENLGAALQPQPKPEPGERGAAPGCPYRAPTPAGGLHLPSEAPGRRGRRAFSSSCWSALCAEERAPLRLFLGTPPGGVRLAWPLRLLNPVATQLPSPLREEPQPLSSTARPAVPAPAE